MRSNLRTRRPRRVNRRRGGLPRRLRRSKSKVVGRTKTYNYSVNLLPEYLTSTNGTAAGVFAVVSDQASKFAPIRPADPSAGISATQSTPDAAASGVAGFYSFGMALPFSLADLQQFQALASQYDYYRINSVTCRVTYLSNSANVLTSGVMPTIWAYQDVDDAVVPTEQQMVIGRQGIKRWEIGNLSRSSFSITVKPKHKIVTGLVGGTVNITKPATGWLDCAFPSVQHYGLKLWHENIPLIGSAEGTAAPAMSIQYEFRYNLSFKSPINIY